MNKVLKNYFYWTYQRGSVQYDTMVTLILLFIFVTPWLWDYGARPTRGAGPAHPIQVTSDGDHGFIVTVTASDVTVPPSASDNDVRRILRKAIEPVTGDAVSVLRWETATDAQGELTWKIWARR
jgi:hypothetical protein